MPSIGKIVVKKIIEHKLLPPVYEPIIKGPIFELIQTQPIRHLILSIIGAGGESPKPHKEVLRFITQSVAVTDAVNKIKISGVVGISYTQTSFTFESYTIAPGVIATKTLSDSIIITEPLSVRRAKSRRLAPEIDLNELSHAMQVARTKSRAIPDTIIISETLTAAVSTQTQKTLSETSPIAESLTKIKESKRLRTETVSESGDVTITLPTIVRPLSESVSVSESVTFEVTHLGGINITRTLEDTIDLTETIARQTTTLRSILQSIALADNLIKLIVTTRKSFTSSFTPISFTSTARGAKILTETIGESHTLRMAQTKFRSLAIESVTLSDTLSAIVTAGRVADIVPISEEVVRAVGRSKVLGDTVIISDLLTSSQADIVTVSDEVTRVVGRTRGLSQSVTIVG